MPRPQAGCFPSSRQTCRLLKPRTRVCSAVSQRGGSDEPSAEHTCSPAPHILLEARGRILSNSLHGCRWRCTLETMPVLSSSWVKSRGFLEHRNASQQLSTAVNGGGKGRSGGRKQETGSALSPRFAVAFANPESCQVLTRLLGHPSCSSKFIGRLPMALASPNFIHFEELLASIRFCCMHVANVFRPGSSNRSSPLR